MPDFLHVLPPALLMFACAITLMGGFVKGAVGFAMPLIMVSGMGILIDPQIVVAGVIIPIVVTNCMQVARAGLGPAWDGLKEHWRYVGIVCLMILISAQFLRVIPTQVMFIVLGVPVVMVCLIQLIGWHPVIPARSRRLFEWVTGAISGMLGGLAGTWGPTTVLYLLALDTPREKQMAVQGVIYGLGSLMLLAGHLKSGVLNAQTWPLSAVLVLPAIAGMWLGFKLGDRFDQARFRRVTLWVLVIAGANLIRRGLVG